MESQKSQVDFTPCIYHSTWISKGDLPSVRGYQLCTQGWSVLLHPLPGCLKDNLGANAILEHFYNKLYPQTQSQELGAETVVDNEMLIDLGMVRFFFIIVDRSFDSKVYTIT